MGFMCCKSLSLYNAKECDDCGKCGKKGEVIPTGELHKFNCSLSSPVKPAVKEHLERIRARNDKR